MTNALHFFLRPAVCPASPCLLRLLSPGLPLPQLPATTATSPGLVEPSPDLPLPQSATDKFLRRSLILQFPGLLVPQPPPAFAQGIQEAGHFPYNLADHAWGVTSHPTPTILPSHTQQIGLFPSFLLNDVPIPISLTLFLSIVSASVILYLRWSLRQLRRNQDTEVQSIHTRHENAITELRELNGQLNQHIGRLRTEQMIREKQSVQLRNRLEQREKLLERLTGELLPQAMKTPELTALARGLQQACQTAEFSARFDNKLLQRLPASFERALAHHFPKLSDEDIRLSGYLFLDLPNKEIAQIRNISAAGVSKSRNRLRKKLKLRSEVNLTAYMRTLVDGYPDADINLLAQKYIHPIPVSITPTGTPLTHPAEIVDLSSPPENRQQAA